ncbi:PAS domain-containing protein [Nisaea nitritireducens]|uniref:PAS domain-containing protein n=1 Tax=Nisaea nitritireducens TaxID=568392 RepID=UPI001867A2FD|nr:PAS domain-containing protein [Nisaea nitritireducens]
MTVRQPPQNPLPDFELKNPDAVYAPEDLVHPELRALFSFWQAKAGTRAAPTRQDLDVFDLKQWLPHIQLVDVVENFTDIRYRVVGTWIVERYGQDDTGRTITEIGLTDHNREIRDEFLATAENMTPQSIVRPFYDQVGVKEFSSAERLMLPLSTDGRTCDKVLSAIYYLSAD